MASKIFANYASKRNYFRTLDLVTFDEVLQSKKFKGVEFPVDFDTEFLSGEFPAKIHSRQIITAQIKPVMETVDSSKTRIFANHQLVEGRQYPPITDDGLLAQTLNSYGMNCELHFQGDLKNFDFDAMDAEFKGIEGIDDIPYFCVTLYAYFAVADFSLFIGHKYAPYLRELYRRKRVDKKGTVLGPEFLELKRRLTTPNNGYHGHPLKTHFLITVNTKVFRLVIKVMDICAINGNASYGEVANNQGITLDVKDSVKKKWIHRMHELHDADPQLFHTYAVQDLHCHEIVTAYAKNIEKLYAGVGLSKYYNPPKLTVGSTVVQLIEAFSFNHLQLPEKAVVQVEKYDETTMKNEMVEKKLKTRKSILAFLNDTATPRVIAGMKSQLANFLSKGRGGRCRSNNPTFITGKGRFVDIDLKGAYANAMIKLPYALGKPVIFTFQRSKTLRTSLREFLKTFGKELTNGLWIATFSTIRTLEYEQDLFSSFINQQYDDDNALDLDKGSVATFSREIENGLLTSQLLDIVMNAWTARQRNDFLDACIVEATAYYPPSMQIFNPTALFDVVQKHEGLSPYKPPEIEHMRGDMENPTDCHHWTLIPLGDLVAALLAERAKQPKGSPLNILYKLFCNTFYGVSVSRYFQTSNAIYGNNVTGMVRGIMYLAEKGLNLFGSITDGHFFNLDKVVFPSKAGYLNSAGFTRLYKMSPSKMNNSNYCSLGPLPCDELDVKSIETAAMEHILTLFPNVNFIRQNGKSVFTFELKEYGDEAADAEELGDKYKPKTHLVDFLTLRGSSDYYLITRNGCEKLKMRGSESKKKHYGYAIQGDILKITDDYANASPAVQIMRNLTVKADRVKPLNGAIRETLLKPAEYADKKVWEIASFLPGDTIAKRVRLTHHSLTAHTFQTIKQMKSWHNALNRLKTKYGLGFELYFTTGETINYKKMINAIDDAITRGIINPTTALDKSRHRHRKVTERVDLVAADMTMSYHLNAIYRGLFEGISECGIRVDTYLTRGGGTLTGSDDSPFLILQNSVILK